MTREEIIQAITDDKMMPFIQSDQLANIVDFVIKNSQLSLPSNLDEAAEDMLDDAAYDWVMGNFGNPKESLFDFDCRCFKAGAEWMAGQGVIIEGRIAEGHREGYPALCLPTNTDNKYSAFNPGDKVVVQIRKK